MPAGHCYICFYRPYVMNVCTFVMFPNIISLFYCLVKSKSENQSRLLKIEVYIKLTF